MIVAMKPHALLCLLLSLSLLSSPVATQADALQLPDLGSVSFLGMPGDVLLGLGVRPWQADFLVPAIAEALASEAHGVAVAGPAGSGKTALVGQYARAHADDYPGGVLYADQSMDLTQDVLTEVNKLYKEKKNDKGGKK